MNQKHVHNGEWCAPCVAHAADLVLAGVAEAEAVRRRMVDPLVYSPAEVATLLKVHTETVRRWLVAGTLPGFKAGGLWLIAAERLHDWVVASSDAERLGVSTQVGRPLGGGDLVRPARTPEADRPVRGEHG